MNIVGSGLDLNSLDANVAYIIDCGARYVTVLSEDHSAWVRSSIVPTGAGEIIQAGHWLNLAALPPNTRHKVIRTREGISLEQIAARTRFRRLTGG